VDRVGQRYRPRGNERRAEEHLFEHIFARRRRVLKKEYYRDVRWMGEESLPNLEII
jgi:hypothetical protein